MYFWTILRSAQMAAVAKLLVPSTCFISIVCCSSPSLRAQGETSSRLIRTDQARQYPIVKRLVENQYRRESSLYNESFGEPYDVVGCSEPSFLPTDFLSRFDVLQNMIDVAQFATRLRTELSRRGYPEAYLRQKIGIFEEKMLKTTEGEKERDSFSELRRLSRALNLYRKTNDVTLPETVALGECGDGGPSEGKLSFRPPESNSLIIPRFLYRLCAAQGIDPNQTTECDYWRSARGRLLVVGKYFYKVTWPNEIQRDGFIEITSNKTFEIKQ
jgi:hypothetical protein